MEKKWKITLTKYCHFLPIRDRCFVFNLFERMTMTEIIVSTGHRHSTLVSMSLPLNHLPCLLIYKCQKIFFGKKWKITLAKYCHFLPIRDRCFVFNLFERMTMTEIIVSTGHRHSTLVSMSLPLNHLPCLLIYKCQKIFFGKRNGK